MRDYNREDVPTAKTAAANAATSADKPDIGMPEFISVISSSQYARIRIDDIECIEQEGRKIHIVTARRDYTFYENMSTIIMSLGGRAFYRPMKGLIINFDHVRDITGNYVNFHSGQCVSMGRNSITKTRQAYRKYLMNYPPYSQWEPVNAASGQLFGQYKTSSARINNTASQVAEKTGKNVGNQTKKSS